MSSPRSSNKSYLSRISSPPSGLPDEVKETELYPRCTLDVLGLFAATSCDAEAQTAFLRLLPSAVDAEPESYNQETQTDPTKLAAIAILQRHPELLFRTGVVSDHFGRRVGDSPYRIFLGAGDIWALKQVYELILPHIEDGVAIAQAQFREQFPDFPSEFDPENLTEEAFYDDRNIVQIQEVKDQLEIIVTKITADPCTNGLATSPETTNAAEALRQIFAPKEDEVIKTGLHFPLAIMQEVYRVYRTQFDPWSYAQLAFFSREVIGSTLAASTAVDGQCYKNGLKNLENMKEKGPDRQDGLFCTHPKGILAKLAPISNKLGRTMFVDAYDGGACFLSSEAGFFDWYNKNGHARGVRSGGGGCVALAGVASCAGRVFRVLCKTKAETLGSYYAATRKEVNTLTLKA